MIIAAQKFKKGLLYYGNLGNNTLKQCSDATDYLENRGLNHPGLINTFKLGFANRTLSYRLPEKNRKAGSEIRGLLQSVGILRKSGHEHFNGSIVVPVLDENHQIKEVYGRKILGNRLRKGTAQHLYLPGEHEGVFNLSSLAASDEVIICESLIDAMTFWVNGFKNVTSSYGTNGFTEEILNALINHEIKRVLIAYDRDDAGNNSAEKLAERLSQYDIDCYRVLFPKNMDANEYALQMSPASKALGLVIRKAEPMLQAKARKLIETKSKGVNQEEDRSYASMQPRHTVHPEHKKPSSLVAKLPEPTSSPQPKAPIEIDAQINEREIKMMLYMSIP